MEVSGLLYHWGKDAGNHWRGGWVGPIAGLDTVAKAKKSLPLPEIENLS
jgi:hypothetical protein